MKTLSGNRYTAVRNQAFNRQKHDLVAARWRRAKEVEIQLAPMSAPGADEEVRSEELARAIEQAILRLPPRCR